MPSRPELLRIIKKKKHISHTYRAYVNPTTLKYLFFSNVSPRSECTKRMPPVLQELDVEEIR